VTNGTDNHLILVDLRNKGISGSKAEFVCEKADISLNKNSVFGDTSAINPGGVRIGTSALTTRGFKEKDFLKVGELLHKCFELCIKVQNVSGKKLVDFKKAIQNDFQQDIVDLRQEVNSFAEKFEFIEEID
jgi:glycine hydroxymethyltransferase